MLHIYRIKNKINNISVSSLNNNSNYLMHNNQLIKKKTKINFSIESKTYVYL